MTAILNLAVALLAGLLMTRIFSRWHLPDVTAFLVTGVLIGPFVLGRLGIPGLGFASYDQVEALSMISDVAMGFIAFSIGNEFRLSQLKKTGKQAMIIGVLQALAALAFVDIALVIFHFLRPDVLSVPAAITLGAIATATAPATTLMVVRQYKAKGELTDLLLPIVALDDAVGLIAFAVSFGIARAMDSAQFSLASILLSPLIEIVGSLLLGAIAGFVLTKLETMFRSNSNRLSLSIAFIFLMVGLSAVDFTVAGVDCGFSPLLVCMMLGTVFCNICPLSDDLMNRADKWSTPMLAVFFVVSGANLRLSVFSQGVLVLIGVVYIIARSAGKYCGARWSAKAVGCDHTVQKYLGIMLLPQEGVALGMCVSAQALGADGELIRNIILFSVLIYELVGPLATKESLKAAGAITEKPREVLERRERKLAEAEPKEGNFIFTGITNSVDFPLYTAVAEAAGDDDTINTGKYFIQIRLFFFKDFGIDPADVHLGPHGVSRMGQRFRYGKVGVMEPDIFTDKGDLHFLFCRGHAFYHGFPVFHIHRTIFKSQFFQGDMVETFLFHKKRHFINAVRRQVIDDGFRFHIAKHADFLFHFI